MQGPFAQWPKPTNPDAPLGFVTSCAEAPVAIAAAPMTPASAGSLMIALSLQSGEAHSSGEGHRIFARSERTLLVALEQEARLLQLTTAFVPRSTTLHEINRVAGQSSYWRADT